MSGLRRKTMSRGDQLTSQAIGGVGAASAASRCASAGVTRRGLSAAAVPVVFLAACGVEQGGGAPAASQGPKTVIFHSDWIATARGETVRRALEQWAKENPTIKIDHQ